MPHDTTTIVLGEELERLRTAHDSLDETETEDNDEAEAVTALQTHVRRKANGVGYLLDEYGDDVTVTIGALTMGDRALVDDALEAQDQESAALGFDTGVAGTRELYEAAAGLVDAPFLADDVDGTQSVAFDQCVAAVSNEPPQVGQWLVDRVRDATSLPDRVGNG